VTLLILVVDDEPDVELLFRQQFRHDLRAGRFTMEFAPSAPAALQRITDAAGVSIILILSDISRSISERCAAKSTCGLYAPLE
jgi:CheY-like chemotaxis protein